MGVNSVLVCGGGIGGLTLAVALGQRGVNVEVVEIKPTDAVQGIGISVPFNALRVLDSIGVVDDVIAAGLVMDSYRFFNSQGDQLATIPVGGDNGRLPGYVGLPRPAYSAILRQAAEKFGAVVHFGVSVADVQDYPDGAHVTFTDGRQAVYDVVAGFDGVRSACRTRFLGAEFAPVYTGVCCWRVEYDRPEDMTYMASFQGVGTKGGLVPMNDESMYLFHLSKEPEPRNLAPDTFREVLANRLQEYSGILGEIRDNLPDSCDIILSPLERVLLPPPWHRGRVVVGGDAAHAMSPNIGQGGSSSLEDALVLAEELVERDSLEDALTSYAGRRYPRTKFVQDLAHKMLLSEVDTSPETVAGRADEIKEMPTRLGQMYAFLSRPL